MSPRIFLSAFQQLQDSDGISLLRQKVFERNQVDLAAQSGQQFTIIVHAEPAVQKLPVATNQGLELIQ